MSMLIAVWGAALALVAEPPRPAWTTSCVTGSPEPPPPLQVVRAFPKIKFDHSLSATAGPGGRMYVIEQNGKVWSFPDRDDAEKADLVFDIRKELRTLGQASAPAVAGEAYGMAFHPQFAANGYCYLCYVVSKAKGSPNWLPDGTRISRFKMAGSPPRFDPASEEIVITYRGGGHNAGDVQFGPDGCLYIPTGDAADPAPPDPLRTGQDCSDLLSSILRIDVDRPDPGKKYGIPKDNPFVGIKDVRPEIWAFGFRNPWRISFDRATGKLWTGDVGWELWEMVHNVRRGGNYGWSIVEGPQSINPTWPLGPTTAITPPALALPHTISASVTGGYVYRGRKFPEFVGHYFFGDWETHRLWAAKVEGDGLAPYRDVADSTLRVVAFAEDHAGELLAVDYDAGTLHRFERAPPAARTAAFPGKLSETGLFADAGAHRWAPGVVGFDINVPLWQDGAVADRAVAIPGTAAAKLFKDDEQMAGSMFSRRVEFPADSVLAKTISLDLVAGDPKSRRRIETQLLHWDGRQWRGYGYRWNDAQTDAELVPAEGDDRTFAVQDAAVAGGVRGVAWSFASRTQCLQCHTPWAKSTLAFTLPQLNREIEGQSQLQRLADQGVWKPTAVKFDWGSKPPPTLAAADHPKLAPAAGPGTLEEKARAYLHVNCSHCHCSGGGGAVDMQLIQFCKLAETKALDVAPARGGFGLADPKIIAAGDPYRSVLYYRMAKHGSARMPHLGAEHVDAAGLELVRQWIAAMAKSAAPVPSPGLTTPAAALALARELGLGKLPEAERRTVLAAAAKLEDAGLRDLFAGFQPYDPAKAATLGPNPRVEKILAKAGDAARGAALFRTDALQCLKCHQLDGAGIVLGPDLAKIGGQRTRAELLESMLRPSAKIDPKYATHLLRMADGATAIGLLAEQNDREIVLRDAKNQTLKFPRAEVEALKVSPVSMMPEGLLRDLTPEQAADLLAYLAAKK